MTMKDMSVLQLLPYVLFLTISLAWPCSIAESATGATAIRADLTHVDSGRGFTKRELLRRMAARSRARADSLCSPPGRGGSAHAVTVPTARGTTGKTDRDSEYLIHFGIGTPRPQHVALTLDTGSDLIWTQCGCTVCFDQPFPLLDPSPSASATAHGLSCFDPLCARGGLPLSGCTVNDNVCLYTYSYGDQSVTTGKMVEDTFTFQAPNGKGVATVANLRFGCGFYNTGLFKSNESGLAGFGRGPLSLPSQLKVGRFSYCFTTIVESKASPVFLGTPDNLGAQATGPIQSTPFVRNPASMTTPPTLYYLSLKGITVGNTRLPFNASTFALKGTGATSGTIIDSGTGMTTFPEAVYRSILKAFMSQVPLPTEEADGMLCFDTKQKQKAPAVPKLILHLEGADWDLPRENYVLDIEGDDKDGGGRLCLVMGSSGESNDMTIIGNFQQQNMHIVYDLQASKMVFVPARCDKL